MGELLPILLAAAVAVLVLYAVSEAKRKRRSALEASAGRLGLAFDPGGFGPLRPAARHAFFQRGHSRKAAHTMSGRMTLAGYPIQVEMGDFRYVTGHGKQRQVHNLSYAIFQLPFVGVPDLLIRKEHLGHKLLGGMGFDDIDFESEEFSRAFWVKSEDRRFAYDVVHPRMMEFLLRGPTPAAEIVGDLCLVLEGNRRWDPDTFEGAPGWFQAFLDLWPGHLTHQLARRTGSEP